MADDKRIGRSTGGHARAPDKKDKYHRMEVTTRDKLREFVAQNEDDDSGEMGAAVGDVGERRVDVARRSHQVRRAVRHHSDLGSQLGERRGVSWHTLRVAADRIA